MKHLLSLLILLTVLVSCEEQEVTPVEIKNVDSPVVTEEDGEETPPTP